MGGPREIAKAKICRMMVGRSKMIFEQSQFNQMIDIIEIKNKSSITAMYVDQLLTISLNKNDQDLS